jgi:tryptophan-rich sensory protein
MSTITETVHPATPEAAVTTPRRWRWYHGVIFYIIVQVTNFLLSGLVSTVRGNRDSLRARFFGNVPYFKRLKQSIFAPPSWAFGPVWTINNISETWGLLLTLNKPKDTPGRRLYLTLQGLTWLNFVVFNAGYFSMRSPINALVLTFTFFLLTVARLFVAIFGLKDSRVALALATTIMWLMSALTAALFQAAWNRDDLYKVGPFIKPVRRLLKKRSR